MKRKLVSVLLAMTLCGSLAVPAFAEPTEETHTPEETTPLEVAALEENEEGDTSDSDFYQRVMTMVDGLDIELEVDKEDTALDVEFYQQVMAMVDELDIEIDADVMDAENSNTHICVADYDEEKDYIGRTYDEINGDKEQHRVYKTYMGHCMECKNPIIVPIPIGTENHSFRKGSLDSCRQGDANGHEVRYPYTCWKCEMTIMGEWETEPHSLQKTFTGNHYHVEGSAKHMAEYRYTCSGCGYSTTKWEYYICPGGSGGGCLYPTSLDEEELMGDVTGSEDAALPEDVTGPAESENLQAKEIHEHENESETLIYTWDCEFPDYSDGDLISWTWTEGETEEGVKVLHLCLMLVEDPAMIDAASTASVNEGTPFHTHLGIPEVIGHEYKDKGTYHEVYDVIKATCSCGESITKTKLTGEEPHSLQKTFTGNHYHVEGSVKHMAEYRYTCSSGCGYSTTKWEYYICPGGSGGGCLYPTSLDEEELMGDVTGPEDVMKLDETTEPAEETHTPEETTPLEVAALEESEVLTGEKEFAEDECEHWLADYDIEVTTPEGHTVTVTFWEPCDGSCEDPMLAAASSVATAQLSVPCPKCGKMDWDDGKVESVNLVNLNNKDVHGIDAVIVHECQTCHVKAKYTDKWSEPHSWQRGTFTGNHYHNKGDAYHHAEYEYHCPCGASKTQWDTYSCPGGRNDGNCLYPTSLDEEELMGDVTGPEDAALPEDVVLPEDVTTPEDAMELDETGIPEEITTPEETTEPEEPYE